MSYSYLNLRELKISFIYVIIEFITGEGENKAGSVYTFASLGLPVFQIDDYISALKD